jgi:hypothetical protein
MDRLPDTTLGAVRVMQARTMPLVFLLWGLIAQVSWAMESQGGAMTIVSFGGEGARLVVEVASDATFRLGVRFPSSGLPDQVRVRA